MIIYGEYKIISISNPLYPDIFDNILDDAVLYATKTGYNIRNAHASFSFNCLDDSIIVKVNPTILGDPWCQNQIGLYENDVYKGVYTYTSWADKKISLTTGNKKVTIVEGTQNRPGGTGDVLGDFITGIRVFSTVTKVTQGIIVEKIVGLGDSITSGYKVDYPVINSFLRLFKKENNKAVAVYAYGSAYLADFASNAEKIVVAVANIQTLFMGVTTNKYLIIMLGTSDCCASTPAATIQGWYGALLDAIHTADATIKIWCISPIECAHPAFNDATLLDAYRSAITTVVAARSSYCTHIAGKTILTYPTDFGDQAHPTTAGTKKLKDAVYAVMYS
jgi:lysophospholipase L1-like esterase